MDIKKYVRTNDDGSYEIDQEGFQAELDAEIGRAVEKFRNGKGKDEIRKQLEEEAKLSAEQKLQKEREEFEQYVLQSKIALNRDKAKAKMEGKGFTDEELDIILTSTISDDEAKSLATIEKLVNARTKMLEDTKQAAISGLQQKQVVTPTVVVNPDGPKDQGKPFKWSAADIKAAYMPQQTQQ